jgi:hypothetical protein
MIVGKRVRNSARNMCGEDGSSMIELAIILPVLLILFAGAAELGRLFYTYTTLDKATKVGARYLSTSKDATSTSTNPPLAANAALAAQNLVVYGCPDRPDIPIANCVTKPPIVTGLDPAANVDVQISAPDPNGIRYVTVAIKSYPYRKGVFNLASMVGRPNSTFYFSLTPATTMRYMP